MAELARQHIADAHPGAIGLDRGRAGRGHCCGRGRFYDRRRRVVRRWAAAGLAAPPGEFIGRTTIRIG